MSSLNELLALLKQLLAELQKHEPEKPPEEPKEPKEQFSRCRLRLLRAQYNRKLFPEQYTENNPDGLYRGKALVPGPDGFVTLNRESNAWFDWTLWDVNGLELSRDQIKRLKLGYETLFNIGDGYIAGGGQEDDGRPKDWDKVNPSGANISEEAWRTSLGFNVRVHFSDEGEYTVTCAMHGMEGAPIKVRVS
jgi:hypothetical protein